MLPKPDWLDYCRYCGGTHDEAACPQKREEEERAWREREKEMLVADPKQRGQG